MPGTIDSASELLAQVLRILQRLSGDVRAAQQLLQLLGWDLPPGVNDIGLTQFDITTLVSKIDSLTQLRSDPNASDDQIATAVAGLVLALKNSLTDIDNMVAGFQADPDYLSKTQIKDQFFPRLGDIAVIHLVGGAPGVVPLGVLLGIFEFTYMPADPTIYQVEHMRQVVRWDRFGPLVTDPAGLIRDVYGWGTPDFKGDLLVGNIARLVEHFTDSVTMRQLPRAVEEQLAGRPVPEADTDPASQLFVSIVKGLGLDGEDVGVALLPLRASTPGASDAGLAFTPYMFGTSDTQFDLSDKLSLEVDTTADLGGGVAVIIRPGADPQLMTGLIAPADSNAPPATFSLRFKNAAPDGDRLEFFSALGITFDAAAVSAGIQFDVSDGINPAVLAAITDGRIVIKSDPSDGFLASVLPADGVTATVNFSLSYSHRAGLRIDGGAGLSTALVINKQLGPLFVNSVGVAINVAPTGLNAVGVLSASVLIGPLTATIASVGAAVLMQFQRGNLGPFDLSSNFKAPDGVGLAIDAAGVSGGGFLAYANDQYSGVLQLKFNDLALQAFGLITTHVAGADGYSLIALIDANFPPVQLGWGFTLDGVGGLLAIHRTASVDALRAAVKSGKISSILFPTAAISNASQVLSVLDTFFPTAPGRFLFGPMALIGWGTPTVLTASVAVILELPEPIEIILLAKLEAKLPTPSSALVHLNMDALGVLDLTQDELYLDASLFDSKLISFTITGDMALRADWSSQREFLLAIGGFHPQFTPPAGFPSLNRVTINMPSGIVSKLRLAAYLAITSNTVQFGATLDVYIGVSGCGISGHLGFDALLQLDPFQFSADISGSVAITVGGDDLASVSLDAMLTGPAPWHIAGSFKIHIIFFDIGVSFSASWGLDAPAQPVSTVDVGALLNAALADPRNWNSQLPSGVATLVSTCQVNDSNTIFAHPLGMLEVHEQVVPLGLAITHIGQAVPSGATEFSITGFNVGGHTTAYTVQDDFAPAQFFDLSDNDKLSRPSLERHDAGAVMGGSLLANGASRGKTIDYETYYINAPGVVTVDEGVPQPFPWSGLHFVMGTGAAARKIISRSGSLRYAAPGNPVKVQEPVFVVVATANLATASAPAAAGPTYSDAAAALKSVAPAQRAGLQIVGTYELAEVA